MGAELGLKPAAADAELLAFRKEVVSERAGLDHALPRALYRLDRRDSADVVGRGAFSPPSTGRDGRPVRPALSPGLACPGVARSAAGGIGQQLVDGELFTAQEIKALKNYRVHPRHRITRDVTGWRGF